MFHGSGVNRVQLWWGGRCSSSVVSYAVSLMVTGDSYLKTALTYVASVLRWLGTPGTGQACVPYSLQSGWFGLPYSMVVSGWLDVSMAANFFCSDNFKKTRWNLPAQNSHIVTSVVLFWSKPQASLIQRGRIKDSISCWKKGILRQGGKELMQPSWKQATTYLRKLHTCINITWAEALHFKQVPLEILKCTTFWESV